MLCSGPACWRRPEDRWAGRHRRLPCTCRLPRARCAHWPAVTRDTSGPWTRYFSATRNSPHNAHLEVVVENRQSSLEMLKARTVAETQQAINLGHVPSQASREFCFAHAGIPHRFVQLDLGDRQRRQHRCSPCECARRCGNRAPVLHVPFKRRQGAVCGARGDLILVIGERVRFWNIHKRHKQRAVIVRFDREGVGPHRHLLLSTWLLEPQISFDGVDESCAELLLLAVHRQDRHLVATADDQMPSLAGFERTALSAQPTFELGARHRSERTTNVLCNATILLWFVLGRLAAAVDRALTLRVSYGHAGKGGVSPARLHRTLHRQLTPLKKLRPDVPARLQDILSRALERDRDRRYPSAAELRHDLVCTRARENA